MEGIEDHWDGELLLLDESDIAGAFRQHAKVKNVQWFWRSETSGHSNMGYWGNWYAKSVG